MNKKGETFVPIYTDFTLIITLSTALLKLSTEY